MRTKEEVASEKGGRDRFSTETSVAAVTALPACATSVWGGQVSPWQAVSGLVSLQEERWSGAKPPGPQPCSPSRATRTSPHFTASFAGGKSGSRWGVGLPAPELHPSNPWEVREVTPTGSNCQLASRRRGKRGDRGREEKPARRGRGWQEVKVWAIRGDVCPAVLWCEASLQSGTWLFSHHSDQCCLYSPVMFKKSQRKRYRR